MTLRVYAARIGTRDHADAPRRGEVGGREGAHDDVDQDPVPRRIGVPAATRVFASAS